MNRDQYSSKLKELETMDFIHDYSWKQFGNDASSVLQKENFLDILTAIDFPTMKPAMEEFGKLENGEGYGALVILEGIVDNLDNGLKRSLNGVKSQAEYISNTEDEIQERDSNKMEEHKTFLERAQLLLEVLGKPKDLAPFGFDRSEEDKFNKAYEKCNGASEEKANNEKSEANARELVDNYYDTYERFFREFANGEFNNPPEFLEMASKLDYASMKKEFEAVNREELEEYKRDFYDNVVNLQSKFAETFSNAGFESKIQSAQSYLAMESLIPTAIEEFSKLDKALIGIKKTLPEFESQAFLDVQRKLGEVYGSLRSTMFSGPIHDKNINSIKFFNEPFDINDPEAQPTYKDIVDLDLSQPVYCDAFMAKPWIYGLSDFGGGKMVCDIKVDQEDIRFHLMKEDLGDSAHLRLCLIPNDVSEAEHPELIRAFSEAIAPLAGKEETVTIKIGMELEDTITLNCKDLNLHVLPEHADRMAMAAEEKAAQEAELPEVFTQPYQELDGFSKEQISEAIMNTWTRGGKLKKIIALRKNKYSNKADFAVKKTVLGLNLEKYSLNHTFSIAAEYENGDCFYYHEGITLRQWWTGNEWGNPQILYVAAPLAPVKIACEKLEGIEP